MTKHKLSNKKAVSFEDEIERITKLEMRIRLLEKNNQQNDDFIKDLIDLTAKMSKDIKKNKFKKSSIDFDSVTNEEIVIHA